MSQDQESELRATVEERGRSNAQRISQDPSSELRATVGGEKQSNARRISRGDYGSAADRVSNARRVRDGDPSTGAPSAAVVRIISPKPGQWFNVGDLVPMSATFSDPTSTTAPVDLVTGLTLVAPGTVGCLVNTPGSTADATPTTTMNGTTFVWTANYPVTGDGTFWFRFFSAPGVFQGVAESFFQVRAQRT